MGNHDIRFDGFISNRIPELENIHGCSLEHYLTKWKVGMSLVINDHTIIKHRWHGGIHAVWNNILKAGQNIVTGHTHHLMARPFTDYRGIRYGVESGTLSDLWDEVFSYTENNPTDWQPGCAVLNFYGEQMIPELAPLIVDKKHSKWGKIHYQGKWYG